MGWSCRWTLSCNFVSNSKKNNLDLGCVRWAHKTKIILKIDYCKGLDMIVINNVRYIYNILQHHDEWAKVLLLLVLQGNPIVHLTIYNTYHIRPVQIT